MVPDAALRPFWGLLAGFGLLNITYGNVKKEMLAALGERQLIHARQAARWIEAFFQDHVRMLEHLTTWTVRWRATTTCRCGIT